MNGMSLFQDITPCKCDIKFGVAVCPHVRVCPEFVKVIRVECQINEIITKTQLDQVLIHGKCQIITDYIDICRYKIKEIKLQCIGENFFCQGYIFSKIIISKNEVQESSGTCIYAASQHT